MIWSQPPTKGKRRGKRKKANQEPPTTQSVQHATNFILEIFKPNTKLPAKGKRKGRGNTANQEPPAAQQVQHKKT